MYAGVRLVIIGLTTKIALVFPALMDTTRILLVFLYRHIIFINRQKRLDFHIHAKLVETIMILVAILALQMRLCVFANQV